MVIIATTSQSAGDIDQDFAKFLEDSGFPFVPRNKKSLNYLMKENNAQGIVVWLPEGPVLYCGQEKFFFHPSMAKNRLASFRKFSIPDPMAKACALEENNSFLDCTLGLGADAIVASYFCPSGKVTGLESSTAIANITKWGIKLYNSQISWLNVAIKRIAVINCDHEKYLAQLQDNSYDIVYFDPMFRRPVLKSQAIAPLRLLANPAPLEKKVIDEACRVARKRVVVKEMHSGSEFSRLGIEKIIGSRHNKIGFGIIEV